MIASGSTSSTEVETLTASNASGMSVLNDAAKPCRMSDDQSGCVTVQLLANCVFSQFSMSSLLASAVSYRRHFKMSELMDGSQS